MGSSFEDPFLIQRGLWSLVSLSHSLAGLLPYQEPFQFPVPCDAGCWPALSLEGDVAEGVTWVGSSSYFKANLFNLGQTLTFTSSSEKWGWGARLASVQDLVLREWA